MKTRFFVYVFSVVFSELDRLAEAIKGIDEKGSELHK